jgi:hypothetical protein
MSGPATIKAKVIVTVVGGVAEVRSIDCPHNVYVDVEIHDYDNGEALPVGDPRKLTDPAGDCYAIS